MGSFSIVVKTYGTLYSSRKNDMCINAMQHEAVEIILLNIIHYLLFTAQP